MDQTPVRLDYTTLPSHPRILCEPTEQGLRIAIPAASIRPLVLAMIFACVVLLWLAALGATVVLVGARDFGSAGRLWAFIIVFGIAIFVLGSAVILIFRNRLKRRRIPTVLAIDQDQLILLTPELPILRREFPLTHVKAIHARDIGLSMALRKMGELFIELDDRRTVSMWRGESLAELNWVAHVLREVLHLSHPPI